MLQRMSSSTESVKYGGYECVALENRRLRLLVTRSVGPRVLWLSFQGGQNIFAELPDFMTGAYHFRGGHRLWHAPESLERTYIPDDDPVTIAQVEGKLLVTQNVERETGLQKSMEVRLEGETSRVVVIHRIQNQGGEPATLAPWAITQLRTGGIAVLPQATQAEGLQPNRALSLWPYTDLTEPHIRWGRSLILFESAVTRPFKIGFPNPRGWLAYWRNGEMFVKRAPYEAHAQYFDLGSSSEFYCNDQFTELETLGPVRTLAPGETASHTETWELFPNIDQPDDEAAAEAVIDRLGLG